MELNRLELKLAKVVTALTNLGAELQFLSKDEPGEPLGEAFHISNEIQDALQEDSFTVGTLALAIALQSRIEVHMAKQHPGDQESRVAFWNALRNGEYE